MATESATHSTTHYGTCPLCEATCGLEMTLEGREVVKVARRRRRRLQPRLHLPQGREHRRAPRRPRPAHDAAGPPRRRARRGELGRGVRRDRRPARPDPRRRRPQRDRRLPRQPERPHARRPGPPAGDDQGARHAQRLQRHQRRPAPQAGLLRRSCSAPGSALPIPDIDRTDHLLILGANPLASNGSLMTAPDFRGRLRAIRERGGKVVVVDPRRSRTAEVADEHHFIRPGRDAHLLAAIAADDPRRGPRRPGRGRRARRRPRPAAGAARPLRRRGGRRRPAGSRRRRSAGWRASSRPPPSAAVYARIGTTTQEFGTLASWLVDVLNAITGNLDRAGRRHVPARRRRPVERQRRARPRSRRQARPLDLAGARPPRVLRRAAGRRRSPRRSRPRARARSGRCSRSPATRCSRRRTPAACDAPATSLELMVSIDPYLNETTSLADVVLPDPVAAGAPPLRPRLLPAVGPQRRQLHPARDAAARGGAAGVADDAPDRRDRRRRRARTPTSTRSTTWSPSTWPGARPSPPGSPAEGMDPADVVAALGERRGPERILDLMLRCGPYGAGHRRRRPAAGSPGSASTCSSATRTGSTSARSSRGSRRCCGRRAARSSSARSRSSPTSTGSAARWLRATGRSS